MKSSFEHFFSPLEQRCYLANPVIHDITSDSMAAYPEKVITITVHATADAGVRAVVFWLDRDSSNSLHRFVANTDDQPLGEVRVPDSGTTDRFSFQVAVDYTWPANATICADAVDQLGNFSGQPIMFVTIDARPKPFITDLLAETLGNGDIRLTAKTSNDGQTVPGNNVLGVTIFLDQNGNNQWDAAADVDLGAVTFGLAGVFQKTITPQLGWNLTWFAASAFDLRQSTDNFGPNRQTIRRGDATPPKIDFIRLETDPAQAQPAVISTGENIVITVEVTSPAGFGNAGLFYDANQNGVWDFGVDTHLRTTFSLTSLPRMVVFVITALPQFGTGWQSFGLSMQDNSGRGSDSWSSVASGWVKIDGNPWVETASVAPAPVPVGTATMDLNFRVRDDAGVRGVRQSFIDLDGDSAPDLNEPSGRTLLYVTSSRTNGMWRLTFDTSNLGIGTYNVHIWLVDYLGATGPRTIVSFSVV